MDSRKNINIKTFNKKSINKLSTERRKMIGTAFSKNELKKEYSLTEQEIKKIKSTKYLRFRLYRREDVLDSLRTKMGS